MIETECQDCLRANTECSPITQQKQERRRSKCDFKATRTKDGQFQPLENKEEVTNILEDSFR